MTNKQRDAITESLKQAWDRYNAYKMTFWGVIERLGLLKLFWWRESHLQNMKDIILRYKSILYQELKRRRQVREAHKAKARAKAIRKR